MTGIEPAVGLRLTPDGHERIHMKLAARLRRHPRLSLVLLLCLSAGLFWLQHPHTASPAESAPDLNEQAALTVSVIQPEHHSWPQRLTANGNITAWQEASIGSEIGGLRLTELHIDIGDHVTRGQLLARLEDRTVQAELAQTQANLDEASATLQEATANAERARRVRGKGTLSEQQTTAYLTAEQAARARVAGLRAALDRIEQGLRAGPRSVAGCFDLLYRRQIGKAEYGLALAEAVGHINHLHATGRVWPMGTDPQGARLWGA